MKFNNKLIGFKD